WSNSSGCSPRRDVADPGGVRYGVAVITLERDHERALGVRPSVSAVIFDRRRRLLLQQRSDGGQWGLPGGSVEIGESVGDAGARGAWRHSCGKEDSHVMRRIHHVGVVVQRLADAYEFYRDVLGLPLLKEKTIPEQGVRAALLAAGDTEIELLEPLDAASGIGR